MAETHVITTLSKKRAELSGDTYAIGQKRRRECVDVTSSQHPTAASEWSGQPKEPQFGCRFGCAVGRYG